MNTKQLNKLFSRVGGRNMFRLFGKQKSRKKGGWMFLALSGIAAFVTVMFRRNGAGMQGERADAGNQGKRNMSFPPLNQMLTAEFAEEFIKKNKTSSTPKSIIESATQNQGNNQ
ncbi:hypothetical protein [Robertmurraya massiliosenegalensis]|uniref:hypothetical protein n=1 Tax=Robertmurraya massiliosenegalensis TaxID=1287657 RepID=UPI000315DC8A|nr:hypothetical protein [Robertmurraya massiliosenegalensis]